MKLLKSIFWLSFAFVAIGPHVNAVEAAKELSRQTVNGGSQLIVDQMDGVVCADIACASGKLLVAHTLETLPTAFEPQTAVMTPPADIPFPRPRLDRT